MREKKEWKGKRGKDEEWKVMQKERVRKSVCKRKEERKKERKKKETLKRNGNGKKETQRKEW